jgi:hypothetical protein
MRIALACFLLLGCPDNPPPRTVDARDVTRCEHGRTDDQSFIKETWKACDDAARALIEETPGTSLRYTHKACDMGYADGCLHWLDYVYQVMPRDPGVAKPELDAARKKGEELCEEGLEDFQHHEAGTARACFFTARLFEIDPVDQEKRKQLNLKGCELEKDAAQCKGE